MAPVTLSLGRRKPATKSAPPSSDGEADELQGSVSDQDEPVVRNPKRRLVRGRSSRAVTSDSDDDDGNNDHRGNGEDEVDEGECIPARKKAAVEGENRSRMFMVAVEGTFVSFFSNCAVLCTRGGGQLCFGSRLQDRAQFLPPSFFMFAPLLVLAKAKG
jgi:hypothetical protein